MTANYLSSYSRRLIQAVIFWLIPLTFFEADALNIPFAHWTIIFFWMLLFITN